MFSVVVIEYISLIVNRRLHKISSLPQRQLSDKSGQASAGSRAGIASSAALAGLVAYQVLRLASKARATPWLRGTQSLALATSVPASHALVLSLKTF
jgi:hypothetical protein